MGNSFQYEFEDLREALAPANARSVRKPMRYSWAVLGWIVLLTFMICLFMSLQGAPAASSTSTLMVPPSQNLSLLLIPHLTIVTVVLTFIALLVVITWRKKPVKAERERARRVSRAVFVVFLLEFLGLLTANTHVISSAGASRTWNPSPVTAVAAGYAPWVFCLIAALALFSLFRRLNARAMWATRQWLQRPKNLSFNEDKLVFGDEKIEEHIRWSAIIRYRETKHLLVLHNEDAQLYIIPKRAFVDSTELMRFRSMLHTQVAEGEFLPQDSAFPIAPLR